ncbi:MAG: GtrA family protein [Actinomycetota bacterium]|nr:GtrA family protein [Actinomycetota bacterium]MDP9165996.1 GtrA family protein [Actinomycetota bacterium]
MIGLAPSVVGFAGINLLTFSLDLGLLTLLHGELHWPLPLSITLAYGTAFGVSFVLNRSINFRSHGAVGQQLGRYVLVVAINYATFILGVGDGLATLGLDYRLARIVAGGCEAIFIYAAMRWFIFGDVRQGSAQDDGLGSVQDDAVLEVPGDRPGQGYGF